MTLTRFFGREEEIARVEARLLQRRRLVTLTGAGGSGKTRLALEVARRLAGEWRGAVWFAPLADLADAARLPEAIRDALGLANAPGIAALEQVTQRLTQQPSLLVLDNFEHLVDAGALLVRSLLERAPHLTLLVTSRRLLGLEGERELPVAPLPVPAASAVAGSEFRVPGEPIADAELGTRNPERLLAYPSVALFVDRAQAVRPDFALTAANAAAVAALCHRLEGIPLAIELAAARAGVFTPAEMLAQTEQRFVFLTGRRRDAHERHGTLRAALDWSHRLLAPELQRFFTRLSVFQGGWTAAAAEAVCEERAARECLEQLREYSLVLAEEVSGETRFRMLETLREYGAEHLPPEDREALQRRHAGWFMALAERVEPELEGPDQILWLDRLKEDEANIHQALTWATASGEAEMGLRMGSALHWFWGSRGGPEAAIAYLEPLLALPEAMPGASASPGLLKARADALTTAACCRADERAIDYLREALAIHRAIGNERGMASALDSLAEWLEHEPVGTRRQLQEESLALYQALGDRNGMAACFANLGWHAVTEGDLAAARSLHEESLALRRATGNAMGIAISLRNLGVLAMFRGDFVEAETFIRESAKAGAGLQMIHAATGRHRILGDLACARGCFDEALAHYRDGEALFRRWGPERELAHTLASIGLISLMRGESRQASERLREALDLFRAMELRSGTALCLLGLAMTRALQGEDRNAAALLGAAEASRASEDWGLTPNADVLARPLFGTAILYLARLAQRACGSLADTLRERLGEAAFEAARQQGREAAPDTLLAAG